MGSISESGRPPREGNGNPLQYSCLGNLLDRGPWWATVHGVTKRQTWLSNWACMHHVHQEMNGWRRCHTHTHTHIYTYIHTYKRILFSYKKEWNSVIFNNVDEPRGYYAAAAAAAAKSLQSCPTLCDPIDGSPPGSPIPGILKAGTLEWVAISFSNAWKWKVKVKSLSRVWPSATPWTAAFQALLSTGFSRQAYWSRVPLPSPGYYAIIT